MECILPRSAVAPFTVATEGEPQTWKTLKKCVYFYGRCKIQSLKQLFMLQEKVLQLSTCAESFVVAKTGQRGSNKCIYSS